MEYTINLEFKSKKPFDKIEIISILFTPNKLKELQQRGEIGNIEVK